MFNDYKYYLKESYDFGFFTKIGIGLAVWVIGGVLGFIYETVFNLANTGFQTFYWSASTFGPWIGTYSLAALIIFLLMYSFRRMPWLVLIISAAGCSLVQVLVGLCVYYFCDGARMWNYNLEILNFGNLGGFICLRPVIVYAILGLLVIYVIVPLIFRMACRVRPSTFVTLWIILGLVCLVDILYNNVACVLLPQLPDAVSVYQGIGLKFRTY